MEKYCSRVTLLTKRLQLMETQIRPYLGSDKASVVELSPARAVKKQKYEANHHHSLSAPCSHQSGQRLAGR